MAQWTEKRAPLALETLNHPTTLIGAGLPFFTVRKVAPPILAFTSIRGEEVANTRTSISNRFLQDRLDRVIELHLRRFANAAHLSPRMEPGSKQNLVCVDIPDAGNDLLMHQQRLQTPSSASKDPHEFIW